MTGLAELTECTVLIILTFLTMTISGWLFWLWLFDWLTVIDYWLINWIILTILLFWWLRSLHYTTCIVYPIWLWLNLGIRMWSCLLMLIYCWELEYQVHRTPLFTVKWTPYYCFHYSSRVHWISHDCAITLLKLRLLLLSLLPILILWL